MKYVLSFVITTLLFIAPSARAQIINGSFELPVLASGGAQGGAGTGWTDDLGQSIVLQNQYGGGPSGGFWPGASNGSNYLFMGNSAAAGAIHQDIILVGGASYTLSFDLANFLANFNGNGAKLFVDVINQGNSTSIVGGPQTFTRPLNAGYASQSLSFTTTTTGTYRLAVSSASGFGTNVDNFSLSLVPEPTSLSLLALGAIGLLARRRTGIRK